MSEVIEPSAGNGSFSEQIPSLCWAYDIEPEHPNIIKQDYLTLDVIYLWGRLIIGNPPFGRCLNMAQKFFQKSTEIADYIAFILPISQLNNSQSFYQFDLIYSEDLGKQLYTNRILHCCFNIYKRPESGECNLRQSNKLKDIKIIRQDSSCYDQIDNYDLRMCYWGDGSAGKILNGNDKYSGEYKIVVNNSNLKKKVVDVLSSIDWHKELNAIAMLRIKQYHIYEILKRYIPEIN